MSRVLIALYLIEAGLILIAAPWIDWWQRNYFADRWSWLAALMGTTAMRGVVVAIGLVTIGVGIADLWLAMAGRIAARRERADVAD